MSQYSYLARYARPVAAVVVAALVACASDDTAARRDSIVAAADEAYTASHKASAPPESAEVSRRAPAVLTDNNILARLAQGDRMELQVARIAIGKATRPDLKTFARQLADNHSAAENDARTLGQRLKIPEKPAVDDTTKAYEQKVVAQLNALPKGAAFDTSYVRHLVDSHTAMLAAARAMEPKASNAEVRKLVQGVIPELERIVARARVLAKAPVAKK
jgi:putative membrane protein